ncbi:class I SAM-dependent methyltransferase [Puniceicoccaceae bacterium K14]|nr:class I SAM-dependent methyltransferase [Puniceicoccaceae bacterium K14]
MKRILSKEKPVIDPQELIKELSIEEFNKYSDEYYKKLPLPTFQQAKPFSASGETAQHFVHLGLLFEALQLGPSLKVLDFGAGTCWVSKMIWQMGCSVVSTDVSEEALKLGEDLVTKYPVPKNTKSNWEGRLFDGHRIDASDEYFDRIICYDVFHHVPNQETVIKEFYRVLDNGGIIGFSEPLGDHSSSAESQKEMRDFTVLENDLDMHKLADLFNSVGFKGPYFKVAADPSLAFSLEERDSLMQGVMPEQGLSKIQDFIGSKGIYWFTKGDPVQDSRRPEGLSHIIVPEKPEYKAKIGEILEVKLKLENNGTSRWLHDNEDVFGVVNVGTRLIDPSSGEVIADHARARFPHDIDAGVTYEMTIPLTFEKIGIYTARIELVSEYVCWFSDQGSDPAVITINVT